VSGIGIPPMNMRWKRMPRYDVDLTRAGWILAAAAANCRVVARKPQKFANRSSIAGGFAWSSSNWTRR